MRQITSEKFKAEVKLDPAWASKLTEPVEVTDFCDMSGSEITHLSPLLHFTGKNNNGYWTNFRSCASLKTAEGKFRGAVSFSYSGIEKIGDLSCGKDNNGDCAFFLNCKSLKVAEGKFPGWVGFCYASIEKIGNLTCGKNNKGNSAFFARCSSLTIARGRFEGHASFSESAIETIEDLSCGKNQKGIRLNIKDCEQLKEIPVGFSPEEVWADPKLLGRLKTRRLRKAFERHLQPAIVKIW